MTNIVIKTLIKFNEHKTGNLDELIQLKLLCVALVHIQMLREEFIFVKDLRTYWTWKCFCNDAVHRSPMALQIRLVCVSSITIFCSAPVWLFARVYLKNVKFLGRKHF